MKSAPPSLFSSKVSYTTLPLLLLAFLSLSSAWAGAFNNGIISPTVHQRRTSRAQQLDGSTSTTSSFLMKTASSSPKIITRDPASSSFLSLSTLLFLRGGQQDEDTVTSDETASLDADESQRNYGSRETSDVELTESHPAADASDEESGDSSVLSTEAPVSSSAASKLSSPLLTVMAPASKLLQTAAAFYSQQLTARPILTKSLTAGIIFGLSDYCAQLIERGESDSETAESGSSGGKSIVFSRILTTFLVGLLFFGPAANAWYAMIFKLLPSTSLLSTLQKAALGQIIFGPTFTCVFFAAGMIQGGSFSLGAWLSKIKSDLPGVWASGLGFWPAVDFISYKVVPVQWIPLFVNFCSFVWTIYLSLVANRDKSEA